MAKVLQLEYDAAQNRLTLDGWELHCGQPLEVLLPDRLGGGTWRQVRVELGRDGWYIPGHPDVSPVGLWAREYDPMSED